MERQLSFASAHFDLEDFKREFCRGFHILKFPHSGGHKPHMRDMWLSARHDRINVNKAAHHANKGVLIHDIIKVVKGCNSHNFAHHHMYIVKHAIDEECCFSIVGHERSFDFKCNSVRERDRIVRGVQLLRREDYNKDHASQGFKKRGGFTRDTANTVSLDVIGKGAHLPESETSSEEEEEEEGGEEHHQQHHQNRRGR